METGKIRDKCVEKGHDMAMQIRFPVGIEDFEEIRTWGFYYVDKTGLIRDLLENLGKEIFLHARDVLGKL